MWRKFINVPGTDTCSVRAGAGSDPGNDGFPFTARLSEPRGLLSARHSVPRIPMAVWWAETTMRTGAALECPSLNGVPWLLHSPRILDNAYYDSYLLYREIQRKQFWGGGSFLHSPEKEILGWKKEMRFLTLLSCWPQFLHPSQEEVGPGEHSVPSCGDIFFVWAFCRPAAVCNYSARQWEDVLSPPCFCICQAEFFFGQHLFLFPLWCCLSWPQK